MAGSGRDAFFQLLQKGRWLAQPNAKQYQVAHGLLGALTNEEFRTGNTIANRWGGGFEALTFSQESGRFEKIGDVLHTFWGYHRTFGSPSLCSHSFIRLHTGKTHSCCEVQSGLTNGTKLKTNDITLIPPLLKEINDYDLEQLGPVDFSYRAVCCHVLIKKQSNRDSLFWLTSVSPGRMSFSK